MLVSLAPKEFMTVILFLRRQRSLKADMADVGEPGT